jgi:hypothetical protein
MSRANEARDTCFPLMIAHFLPLADGVVGIRATQRCKADRTAVTSWTGRKLRNQGLQSSEFALLLFHPTKAFIFCPLHIILSFLATS